MYRDKDIHPLHCLNFTLDHWGGKIAPSISPSRSTSKNPTSTEERRRTLSPKRSMVNISWKKKRPVLLVLRWGSPNGSPCKLPTNLKVLNQLQKMILITLYTMLQKWLNPDVNIANIVKHRLFSNLSVWNTTWRSLIFCKQKQHLPKKKALEVLDLFETFSEACTKVAAWQLSWMKWSEVNRFERFG